MFSFLSSYVGRDVESAECKGVYYAKSFDSKRKKHVIVDVIILFSTISTHDNILVFYYTQ